MKGLVRTIIGLVFVGLVNYLGLDNEWAPLLAFIAGATFIPGVIAFSKTIC